MKQKTVFLIVSIIAMFLLFQVSVAQDDDKTLQEYPDGAYGISVGGGYEEMPDGTFIAAPDYRDIYADTDYGPITREGFAVFPDFKFKTYEEKPMEERPETYYIYYEA